MIALPGKKFALIIMTNSSNGESIFKELVEKIAGVTIPWEWEGYTPYRETVKLPNAVLQQYTGEYDGKLKATITLVNGQLKVKSETTGLPETNLYAENDHHFFLKVMNTEVDFVKDANGKVTSANVDDEGEHYELTKVDSAENKIDSIIKLPRDISFEYTGNYALSVNPKRIIRIEIEKNHLVAKISKEENEELIFQTHTKFRFKNVADAEGEFVRENGKVIKFIIKQNGIFQWNKIK